MQWQPAQGTQPLSPFDHQVAGQSSMLRYDKTTVCKPLIAREHFVYKSLPPDLAQFTPEYRGEIEVQLIEEDGYIQLYGLCVDDEAHVLPGTPENHSHEIADVKSKEISMKARSTVRLLRSGSYEVSASTSQVFYAADSRPDQPHTQSLNPWSLKNHKRLLDKMRKSEHSHDKIRFILLKNVVADFRHPCILDLKIGSRLHGDDASSVKVASQSEKCRITTSSSLGVRLCGMQVYQVDASAYHSVDKYHGRTLNEVSFKSMLYDFLHNGTRFRSELIQPIVSRLSELIKCLEHLHSFRFYASSLLIIYDGDVDATAGDQETKVQESKPGITADLAAADNTTGHVHSATGLVQNELRENLLPSKELCLRTSDTQKDHLGSEKACQASGLNSFKKLCPSVATQQPAVEHAVSSKECCESAKIQSVGTSSDSSSVYQPVNFPSPCVNPSEELQSVPDVFKCGVLLAELPAIHSAATQAVEVDPSKTIIIHQLSDTPDQPLSSPKIDPIKNMPYRDKPSSNPENSQIGRSLLLQNNQIQLVPNLSISMQDNVHCEQQTVQLDTCKQLLETDSAAEVSLPSISSITPTETHAFPDCHRQSTNTTEKLLPITGYGVPNNDLLQIPPVSVDFAFKEKSIPEVNHSRDHVSVSVPSTNVTSTNDTSHVNPVPEACCVSKHTLELPPSCGNSVKVDVKMIDFAHTTHQGFTQDKIKHAGPDTDYIFGLRNLLNLFQELLAFH
ncbi:hypothetical protein BsWGS_02432 [Bradybaena similaris]